jgi:two-component system, cell cycle sensor histidine kinase and response regulator CckA
MISLIAPEPRAIRAAQATHSGMPPWDDALERLATLTAHLLGTPVALVDFLDPGRQFLRNSAVSLEEPFHRADEGAFLQHSACLQLLAGSRPWVRHDLREDPRFRDSRLVRELGVASAVAVSCRRGGRDVGVLCALDARPRRWTRRQVRTLQHLAALAGTASGMIGRQVVLSGGEPYRLVAENAMEAILTLDQQGAIVFANPAVERVFGYTPEELVGKPMAMLVPERLRRRLQAAIRRFVPARGRRVDLQGEELPGLHRDGREIPLEVSFASTATPRGVLFTGIMRDVSERKRAQEALHRSEEQLRQAQKMEAVGRLAGGVAHDFNNMLSVIRGNAEMLLLDLTPSDAGREELGEIQNAADRAAALTQQLLAFSRKQMLAPKILDLNQAVTAIDRMLHRLIGEDIQVRMELDPALGAVRADAGQLDQVLVNLAVNARDAMQRGGRLTFATRNVVLGPDDFGFAEEAGRPGAYVLLTVSDTGSGMDAETMSKIFEPFFTTKVRGKGTGLGLSTVYGIVKQSDGYIDVCSEPGRGTSFRIYLPRVDEPAEAEAERDPELEATGGQATVLVVEDEEMVRRMTRRFLERAGYTVIEAGNGEEALRLVMDRRSRIDVLLTDLVMPVMGGRDLARRVTILHPRIRILFMSGYANADQESEVVNAGYPLLRKPFQRQDLVARIQQAMEAALV